MTGQKGLRNKGVLNVEEEDEEKASAEQLVQEDDRLPLCCAHKLMINRVTGYLRLCRWS